MQNDNGSESIIVTKEEKKLKKDTWPIVKVVVFFFFLIYAISLLLPSVWGIGMSLKTRVDYVTNWSTFIPKTFIWKNYITAWTELSTSNTNMFVMLWNSLWFSMGLTFVSIFMSATAAYVISKYEFWGRKTIFIIGLLTQIIPIVGGFASQMRIMLTLNFYNNPLVCFALASSFGYNFIILSTFFSNVSWEYAESGFIDGASHWVVFWKIMLPMAITPVLTLALMAFIGYWADYYSPLLYMPSFPTLTSGLYMYQTLQIRYLNWPVLFAGLFLSISPVLILFFIFQRRILDLQFGGGLKG